jgi:hypothetical protein
MTMERDAEARWFEARKRMRKSVDAVFWQDLGIPAPERDTYVDWILDRVFKAEYLALLNDSWTVWRLDDNGNRFAVKSGLPYQQAKALAAELEAKGHKQFYWCEPAQTL